MQSIQARKTARNNTDNPKSDIVINKDIIKMFNAFDKDGNDFLTKDELKMLLVNSNPTDKQLDKIIKRYGDDKTGICLQGFIKMKNELKLDPARSTDSKNVQKNNVKSKFNAKEKKQSNKNEKAKFNVGEEEEKHLKNKDKLKNIKLNLKSEKQNQNTRSKKKQESKQKKKSRGVLKDKLKQKLKHHKNKKQQKLK